MTQHNRIAGILAERDATRDMPARVDEYWHLPGATLLRDQGDEWRLRVRPLSRSEADLAASAGPPLWLGVVWLLRWVLS